MVSFNEKLILVNCDNCAASLVPWFEINLGVSDKAMLKRACSATDTRWNIKLFYGSSLTSLAWEKALIRLRACASLPAPFFSHATK